MSASITLAHAGWALPDGRPLLENISLGFQRERVGLVGRNGVGKTTLLRLIAGEIAAQTGSVAVEGRLGILRQSLTPAPDQTIADLFGARAALDLLRRAELGAAGADELAEADWTLDARMEASLARVGLAAAPDARLDRLSGGQRTRAALAALVFGEPDFLLLDEPTNNLDREGRAAVVSLLAGWDAGAIVVSHDRALLETMDAIVELTTLGAARYGGNWSAYRTRKALDLAAAGHDLARAERDVAELARAAQAAAERKARKDRAGKRKAMKGDMPRILLGGRKERSENSGGNGQRASGDRQARAAEAATQARARIEVLQPLSVSLAATGLPAGRVVVQVDHATAGYVQDRPVLSDFSMQITGPERVAVTGPNGSGKTTLLALLSGRLKPWRGVVSVRVPFALLDQQVSLLEPETSILDNFRRLNSDADINACRAALARFMFRADAALQRAGTLSGGQRLRAGLACVVGGDTPPSLLILDEPTNHLDIEAIEAVEAGLRAYDGALLIVSHDEAFLANVGVTRQVSLGKDGRADAA